MSGVLTDGVEVETLAVGANVVGGEEGARVAIIVGTDVMIGGLVDGLVDVDGGRYQFHLLTLLPSMERKQC